MKRSPLLFSSISGSLAPSNGAPMVALAWSDSPLAIEPNATGWDLQTARRVGLALLNAAEAAEAAFMQRNARKGLD